MHKMAWRQILFVEGGEIPPNKIQLLNSFENLTVHSRTDQKPLGPLVWRGVGEGAVLKLYDPYFDI